MLCAMCTDISLKSTFEFDRAIPYPFSVSQHSRDLVDTVGQSKCKEEEDSYCGSLFGLLAHSLSMFFFKQSFNFFLQIGKMEGWKKKSLASFSGI